MLKTFIAIAAVTILGITAVSASGQTNAPLQTKVISISGSINDATADKVVSEIKAANKGGFSLIELDITSGGGSVYAGLRILGAMSTSSVPIKTVCEGYCMSMAAVILAHGDTRYATPYTTVMLHQVSSGLMGKLSEMQNQLREVERLMTLLTEIVAEDTGLTFEEVTRLCSLDSYMSTDEAIKLHLIDGVKSEDD